MIRYFRKKLRLSIKAYLDNREHDLYLWEEVIEKTVNIESKASFQPPSRIKKINFIYSKGYKIAKKDIDEFH